MPRPEPRALALSALHGAAELLPVSSSGHVRALGAEADDVALHLGPLAATLIAYRRDVVETLRRLTWRRVAMHALAGGIPSAAGLVVRRDRLSLPAGLLFGAALLGVVEVDRAYRGQAQPPAASPSRGGRRRGRGARSRWEAGPADGLWLGLAQAAALWPGVSRTGATLAVARLRDFAPEEAPLLAREIGVPVVAGALALRRAAPPRGEVAASVAGALAVLPVARRVDRGGPLWPWALERAGLALLLLRQSRSR